MQPPSFASALFALLISAILIACDREAPPPAPTATTPQPLPASMAAGPQLAANTPLVTREELRDGAEWDSVVDDKGRVWVAYRDARRRVLLEQLSAGERAPLQVIDGAEHEPVEPELIASGDALELLWRPKLPRKELKFGRIQPSTDAPKLFSSVVDDASQPLADYRLWAKGNLRLAVWEGEAMREGQQYNFYLNLSKDAGATWGEPRLLGPSTKSAALLTEEALVVFLLELDSEGRVSIRQRTFDLATETLGDARHPLDSRFISSPLAVLESQGRWLLSWVTQQGDTYHTLVIEGIYSDDKGATWSPFRLPDTLGMNAGPLHFAADGKGNLLLAFYRAPTEVGSPEKDDIVLLRSRDNGVSWQLLPPLRPAEHARTKAKDVVIYYDPPTQEILLAWQDYRDILTNVYVAMSRDWGETWSPHVPVGRPGVERLGLDGEQPAIMRAGGTRQLIVEEYVDERFTKKRLRLVDLDLLVEQTVSNTPPAKPNEDSLKARVLAFWALFEKGDYQAAYDYFDPTFRAFQSRDDYLKNKGKIRYHAYEIEEVAIQGNVAGVRMRIEASVPPMDLGGKEVSQPKGERRLNERWLNIGGEWYREFYDQAKEKGFINY